MSSQNKLGYFRKHKVLTTLLVVIVVAIVAMAAGGGKKSDSTSSSPKPSSSSSSKATVAKVGEAARDGKFEFTISKITCGEANVGTNQYLTKQAQGQYCRVSMNIKNIGDKAQGLSSSNQKLIDGQGKQYSADDTATLYAAPEGASSTWYNDVNPGNSVKGDIIFDIPKNVTPVIAELHDSPFSGGIKVGLQ